MATALDIITTSLKLLRIVGSNEAPDQDDARDCLIAMNRMMRRWEANGLALGWMDVEGVNDPLPAPPEAEDAIAYNLALRMRPQFGASLDPDTLNTARGLLGALRRDTKVATPVVMDSLPLNGAYYNIRSDEFYW